MLELPSNAGRPFRELILESPQQCTCIHARVHNRVSNTTFQPLRTAVIHEDQFAARS